MRAFIIIVVFLSLALSRGEDAKAPDRTEAAIRLQFGQDGEANFYTACFNVTREVARKKLTIYAIGPTNSITVNEGGYAIEVVPFSREVARFGNYRFSGAYWLHHNYVILSFAAAQFSATNKQIALQVVRLLADANKDMMWTTPPESIQSRASDIPWSNYKYRPLSITAIRDALEKEDKSLRDFLQIEARNWKFRVERYGP